MFDLSLMGRMSFKHAAPAQPPLPALPAGRNRLGIADERDAILYVPPSLNLDAPIPLLVMFHGAGGFPEKVLPFLEEHANRHGFLLLAPHSTFATWDIVIGGNGPDVERLDKALAAVAARYAIDPARLGFAGYSDGASYALSTGITNGDIATHVIAFSGGFMNIFMQEGSPKVFIAHGLVDEQLPIATSGRANAAKLTAAGYDVEYVEFNGKHAIQPAIVSMAIDFFLRGSLQ
ncbi:esterase [Oxalobacteraceae bacterium CAVE-383]|nr:esterase [Oxalobacteraceae bacterium CAVE-383]